LQIHELMKKLSALFFSILILSQVIASEQSNPWLIKLKSGDLELKEEVSTTALSNFKKQHGTAYAIVQFRKIPTNKEKEQLKQAGISLLEYLPNYAFIAHIQELGSINIQELNIRAVTPYLNTFKTASYLSVNNAPDWALSNSKLQLMAESHLNVSNKQLKSFLQTLGASNISIEAGSYCQFELQENKLTSLLDASIIKFVDYIPEPPQKEDTRGRSLHRGNMLDSQHPLGRKYDGSGVSIAIADDGTIGPHIDYTGRVTDFTTTDRGTHGDMTTGIAMGAGNLNPTYKGMAPGAYLYYYDISGYPHISNAVNNLTTRGVVITSTSYSEGCNGGYTFTTRTVDQQTRQNPSLLHVFSAGNSAQANCGYGAGTPWGTITGGRKQGKSVIAVGNLDYAGILTNSSSRGPATDGRIKPDICANGTNQISTDPNNTYAPGGGTSAAAPGIAGLCAQLYQGYREINAGATPPSALIKAALLNTARDIGNPGPDFNFGWGRVNAGRAMTLLEDNRYMSSTVSQGTTNNHQIIIPANTSELKFMLYWPDYEGSTVSAQSLVNNIDLKVVTPNNDTILPWVLDPTPNPANLNSNAVRGIDDLNNMEQVTIDNIMAGTYTLIVEGKVVPQGPQNYFILWESRDSTIEITYPHGGEALLPGTTETIRWDAVGNQGSFSLEYSLDSGATWQNISIASGSSRYRDWVVPNTVTGDALIRITRNTSTGPGASSTSENVFSIISSPRGITTEYRCPDSLKLTWTAVPGASAYEVSKLGAMYMDSIGRSDTNFIVLKNINLSDDNWVSVKALGDGIVGKRANAILLEKSAFNCPFEYDVELSEIISPSSGYAIACNGKAPITFRVENMGDSTLRDIPISASIGGINYQDTIRGPVTANSSFIHLLKDSIDGSAGNNVNYRITSTLFNDENPLNDTLSGSADILTSSFMLPFNDDFEQQNSCINTNGCENDACTLNGGWYNVRNTVGDDFDLKIESGNTPSSNTGPFVDHNPGNSTGNYIYSEVSGCFGKEAQMISPCFDLSGTIRPTFSFWYHMLGNAIGQLRVDIFANNTWTNDVTTPLIGAQGNNWQQRTIDLSAYSGQTINLRFKFRSSFSFEGDIAIDDIAFVDAAVGINENLIISQSLSVFPNPSDGSFTLTLQQLPKNNLLVYDMNGRVVKSLKIASLRSELDLSELPKGVYLLSFQNELSKKRIVIY
jgi:hypothetical protein